MKNQIIIIEDKFFGKSNTQSPRMHCYSILLNILLIICVLGADRNSGKIVPAPRCSICYESYSPVLFRKQLTLHTSNNQIDHSYCEFCVVKLLENNVFGYPPLWPSGYVLWEAWGERRGLGSSRDWNPKAIVADYEKRLML